MECNQGPFEARRFRRGNEGTFHKNERQSACHASGVPSRLDGDQDPACTPEVTRSTVLYSLVTRLSLRVAL